MFTNENGIKIVVQYNAFACFNMFAMHVLCILSPQHFTVSILIIFKYFLCPQIFFSRIHHRTVSSLSL